MHYIFVYGSLKSGFGNHAHFLNRDPLFLARLQGYVLLESGRGYPAIKKGNDFVEGEVYEVSDSELRQLDYLESHPSYYSRTAVRVITNNKVEISAQTYVIVDASTWREYGKTNWK
jgi:gamma-glutamylaminecyclotransferase